MYVVISTAGVVIVVGVEMLKRDWRGTGMKDKGRANDVLNC